MIPLIYFHSVAPAKNLQWSRSYLTLELKHFERLLKYFNRTGTETLDLDEYFDSMGKTSQKKKQVVITFDDGYADFWIYVYPLLQKYQCKATVFVSPGLVDLKAGVRKNLADVWNGNAGMEEIQRWGYLSWEEMRIMEQSGLVDVQSHTYSHTKYFTDGKLKGFHRPGGDCFNAVGNLFPERKPYYIEDKGFEKLIPYGYPLFTETSSVIARRVTINPLFTEEVLQSFSKHNWSEPYNFLQLKEHIDPIYQSYISKNELITAVESEADFKTRVRFELEESKLQIEKALGKNIRYLCWPHGDNDLYAHNLALELGYTATTLGSKQKLESTKNRIPTRIGIGAFRDNDILTLWKSIYKMEAARKAFPFYTLQQVYNYLHYGKKA
jgi:peptidoglycan/xylan/chitin deacetylase (PgdA/CDA1 family)